MIRPSSIAPILALCAVAVLAACRGSEPEVAGFPEDSVAAPGTTPSSRAAVRERLTLWTPDSVRLSVVLLAPPMPLDARRPAVLLLHDAEGSRTDLARLANDLTQNGGYVTLSIDLRGHGESFHRTRHGRDEIYDVDAWRRQGATGVRGMLTDLETGVALLDTLAYVESDSLAAVGSGLGADLALEWAAGDPSARALVLVSPRAEAPGLAIEKATSSLADRPVLIVSANGDATGQEAARRLARRAPGWVTVTIEGVGAGDSLLERGNVLTSRIGQFLQLHVPAAPSP